MDRFNNHRNPDNRKSQQPAIPLIFREKRKFLKTLKQSIQSEMPAQESMNYNQPRSFQLYPQPKYSVNQSPYERNIYKRRQIKKDQNSLTQRTNHQTPNELTQRKKSNSIEIKKLLDQNLIHIFKILRENKISFKQGNKRTKAKIPKLEKKIVQQYIQAIYHDYQIQDPLPDQQLITYKSKETKIEESNMNSQLNSQFQKQKQIFRSKLHQYRKDPNNKMGKKAIQLKQQFIAELLQPMIRKDSVQQRQSFGKVLQNQQYRDYQPSISRFNQKQIKECFRFCFVCQSPVLQANIQIHQRQKCPQFAELFSMDLQTLRSAIVRKILRIKKQTQETYEQIFGDKQQDMCKFMFNQIKVKTKEYLQDINNSFNYCQMSENDQNINLSNNFGKKYKNIMQSFQKKYFCFYHNIKKLQWFIVMLRNLQQKKKQLTTRQDTILYQKRMKQKKLKNGFYQGESRRFSLG